jgi:hypothetical protein
MEGIVVDLGQRAGRSQQPTHDPRPETSYPLSDSLGVWAARRASPDRRSNDPGDETARNAQPDLDGALRGLHKRSRRRGRFGGDDTGRYVTDLVPGLWRNISDRAMQLPESRKS